MGVNFDKVLKLIGEFGRYQKIRFVLLCLSILVLYQYPLYYYIFASFTPAHTCQTFDYKNETLVVNRTEEVELSWNLTKDQCSVIISDDLTNGSTTVPCSTWTYAKDEYKSTIVTEWSLVCGRAWWLTLMQSCQNISMAVGAILFAMIQDWFGRKTGFFLSIGVSIVFGVMSAFAVGPEMFLVVRIVQCLTVIPGFSFPYIIAMEFVGPAQRTMVTSVMTIVFALGSASVGLIAYLCTDWFTLSLASCLPFTLFFSYWFILDESPRWLLTQQKTSQLRNLCKKIALANRADIRQESMNLLLTKTESRISPAAVDSKLTVVDLFRTGNIRQKTLIICFLFVANAIVYMGLAFNVENLEGNRFFNFSLLMLMEVPAGILILIVLDRLGRILPMSFMMIFGGIAAIVVSQIPTGMPTLIIILAAVTKLGISGSFAILCQLSSELFPTQLRGTGSGLGGFLGNLSTTAVPFIIASSQTMKTLPMVIMGMLSVSGGIVVLFLPETFGAILPETITDCSETQVGMKTMFRNITFGGLRDARERIRKSAIDIRTIAPTSRKRMEEMQLRESLKNAENEHGDSDDDK